MTIEVFKTIIELITLVSGVIVGFIGIWKVLVEVKLKLKAETRLAETAAVQSQVKLLEQFSSLMDIAECRKEYSLCDKLIENICSQELSIEDKYKKIEDTIISYPVGNASKFAAIKAIEKLGAEHLILKEPSEVALAHLNKKM